MHRSWRRIGAIARKELREYRRNRTVLLAVVVLPLIFVVQPVVALLRLPAGSAAALANRHELLYMLAVPLLAPAVLGGYAIAGERQQDSLEPALSTPVRSEEFLLGKAIAALVPAAIVSYLAYGLFIAFVLLFAPAGIAPALLRGSDIAAQVVFTPLLAALSTWIAIAVSTRFSDVRVAQQLSLLANVPLVVVTLLIAFDVIPVSSIPVIPVAVLLVACDLMGWRLVVPLFDRERLITSR